MRAPGRATAPVPRDVEIPVRGAILRGTLLLPGDPAATPAPGVVLLGGTFSDTRDGDADPRHRPDIPPHGMYRVLAEALAGAGLAVLRFDRRGSGSSSGRRPDRATEIADATAAFRWMAAQPGVGGTPALVGESAGAYVGCRMAASGIAPRAVVLQGALHRSIEELIAFNVEIARSWWSRGPRARDWLWEHARHAYELAVVGPALLAALSSGRDRAVAVDARCRVERGLEELAYDRAHPPADQLRHLTCPVLVIHGADDLNVPPQDAFATTAALWASGNRSVEVRVLPGADHSLQVTPGDPDERLRERLSMASFRRPFHPDYPGAIVAFLARQLAGPAYPAASSTIRRSTRAVAERR